eukprot:352905-Chlamydomonas_euryale.AAC.1
MSDAPAHHLFVLLGPVDESANVLPDILAVVQVALEGAISRASARTSLAKGDLPQGDLVPWTISQQFQDADFPSLSGARVVRIAVHPELPRAGACAMPRCLLGPCYNKRVKLKPSRRSEARQAAALCATERQLPAAVLRTTERQPPTAALPTMERQLPPAALRTTERQLPSAAFSRKARVRALRCTQSCPDAGAQRWLFCAVARVFLVAGREGGA